MTPLHMAARVDDIWTIDVSQLIRLLNSLPSLLPAECLIIKLFPGFKFCIKIILILSKS